MQQQLYSPQYKQQNYLQGTAIDQFQYFCRELRQFTAAQYPYFQKNMDEKCEKKQNRKKIVMCRRDDFTATHKQKTPGTSAKRTHCRPAMQKFPDFSPRFRQ